MSTDAPTAVEGIDAEPADYVREDGHSGPRWTHEETGLRVGIARDSRPAGRQMTRQTAMQAADSCWIFEVRPSAGEPAEVYERLAGDKQGAIAHAREWMDEHADGQLDGGE